MRIIVLTVLAVIVGVSAFADEPPRVADIRSPGLLRGGSVAMAKAGTDTCVLIGPASLGPLAIGTFEDGSGVPDWNGWTSQDWTVPDTTDTTWHVSDYYAVNGSFSAYCGDEMFPSCGAGDPQGGYGNSWDKILKWGATVTDPGQDTHISVSFAFDLDTESGYDWAFVAREFENEERTLVWELTGDTTGSVTIPVTYAPGEYFGDGQDEIGIWFVGESDSGWSDEDCDYASTGLWRLDDLTITADNGAGGVGPIDFEDQTLGGLERKFLGGVGDFAHILANLGDPDPCVTNKTPQLTFIDDGIVQPATGGTHALLPEHMYAGGWVVNYTGGLTFSERRELHNVVVSPVVPWQDAAHDGARFGYGFLADHRRFSGFEPVIYGEWLIRSTDGDASSIEQAGWVHSPWYYGGGPSYGRRFWDVSEYIVPDRTYVQVALGAVEISYIWGVCCPGSSPAPYYDNVRLESFAAGGPSVSIPTYKLPSDAFPEIGTIDTVDLSRNHIRFDTAENISPTTHEHYGNGDSITIDVIALRDGAALTGRPRFHYEVLRNPLFDPHRTAGLPDSGVIVMDTTYTSTGTTVADRYRVDLPDSGFLFPGDVLHYYFSAEDAVGGADHITTTLPADISGWGEFEGGWNGHDPWDGDWSNDFTVRGLPTLQEDVGNPDTYICPNILIWDGADSEATGSWLRWRNLLGYWYSSSHRGLHFDYYYDKAPAVTAGSGLGARATAAQLDRYRELVFHSGTLGATSLTAGNWGSGGSDDIGLLEDWLDLGGKDLLLCGDELAAALDGGGEAARSFLNERMMVSFVDRSHRDLLGGQLAPRVLAVPGNPVLNTAADWLAYGGCDELREFDVVVSAGDGIRLAVWADPDGQDGGYPYSPMTLAPQANGSRIVSMSMELAHVHTQADELDKFAPPPARARIYMDVMSYFGVSDIPVVPADVPAADVFAAANHPNPFNPVTEIAYSVKAPGHLTVRIYNLRGAVVRTLLDRQVTADGKVPWDGTDNHGGQVSSGVYFYEARMGDEVRIGKMALIK